MKECKACGHVQDSGKFCGKCGTPLIAEDVRAKEEATATNEGTINNSAENVNTIPRNDYTNTTDQAAPQTNEQVEMIKNESKMYFQYYLQQLKTPSAHFDIAMDHFKNSLINIILYIALTAIALYTLLSTIFFVNMPYGDSFAPSFLKVFLMVAFILLIFIVINILAVFITSKLFAEDLHFKNILSKFGGYYVLPIALTILGILLALLKSYTYSSLTLYIGLVIVLGIIPMFVMVNILSKKSKSIDKFYAFLLYIIITIIFYFFALTIFADSTLGEYLDMLTRW